MVCRPIKSVRPIILAQGDRFHPPSQLGSINNPGSEGAAQISVQVFGDGEKRLFRCNAKITMVHYEIKRGAGMRGEKGKSRPPIN
ncbi:MAG: hypothetical protein PHW87_04440 [Methanothrix sp.]|nr:hypothetical protein [Methanothrix sp.]